MGSIPQTPDTWTGSKKNQAVAAMCKQADCTEKQVLKTSEIVTDCNCSQLNHLEWPHRAFQLPKSTWLADP